MKNLPQTTAKHLRGVYFGENWTEVNLKKVLSDVTLEEAMVSVHGLNSIAKLTFHVNYFVFEVAKVLRGEPLTARDKYSWTHPEMHTEADWQAFLEKVWEDGEAFAALIEAMPEEKYWGDFADPKYGKYCSNLWGIIEHLYYHLGQIAVIKKIIRQGN